MARVTSPDSQPRSAGALWLGILGPPAIWLTQFEINYALAGNGHASRHAPALLTTSVIAGAVVLFLAYVTARERRLNAASPLDVADGKPARNRFMATLGLMLCAFFLLAIVAQAIAQFFFPPGLT